MARLTLSLSAFAKAMADEVIQFCPPKLWRRRIEG
jgi:hypothetical protein